LISIATWAIKYRLVNLEEKGAKAPPTISVEVKE
jgi:hypothetical protein